MFQKTRYLAGRLLIPKPDKLPMSKSNNWPTLVDTYGIGLSNVEGRYM
jgi:hypothetical protein